MFTIPAPPGNLDPDSPFVVALLQRLNTGPNQVGPPRQAQGRPSSEDLRGYSRTPLVPARFDGAWLDSACLAFNAFERACGDLLAAVPSLRSLILAGVTIDPQLVDCYLWPATGAFSVRRLDLLVRADGRAIATECDEQPGGIADAYHLDRVHGVNQHRWGQFLSNIADGPLVFVVSHQWSALYIKELRWFARQLSQSGYPASVLPTNELERLSVRPDGVFVDGQRVATVWRQFPIFEACGPLVALVQAAGDGRVRLVPEFASWGNKVWFGVFWSMLEFFRAKLARTDFDLLRRVIPVSVVLEPNARTTIQLTSQHNGRKVTINDYDHLQSLPEDVRSLLVVKLGGANQFCSRSRGVVVGSNCTPQRWRAEIQRLVRADAPLIVQEFHEAAKRPIVVYDILDGQPRIQTLTAPQLLRPWMSGAQGISCPFVAPVSTALELHRTATSVFGVSQLD